MNEGPLLGSGRERDRRRRAREHDIGEHERSDEDGSDLWVRWSIDGCTLSDERLGAEDVRLDDWFLLPDERGNSSTRIDARRGTGEAWTEGNHVVPLVDGATYFGRLCEALTTLDATGHVRFTDWQGDSDELLTPNGPSIGDALAALSARGADVRGLMWRSHPKRFGFSEKRNRSLAEHLDDTGAEVLLDERVRRGGSHHQKLMLIRRTDHEDEDLAFVGGVDLSHGRRDHDPHNGDTQAGDLHQQYGEHPPWHDVQLEVHGPAVDDLDFTFRERWEDPTPLDHRNPYRAQISRRTSRAPTPTPLPSLAVPPAAGSSAVQILRTYPFRRPVYPFAPSGERSVARGFIKAIRRARRLIYVEDQYFWSAEIAEIFAEALRTNPALRLVVLVPRYPERDGMASRHPTDLAQLRAIDIVSAAGGDRVGVYDLENEAGCPVYVHAKVCVIDDVWAAVGSDNLNRRSWTHDSELSCAVIDSELDQREPADLAGLGDGSRRFARDLRTTLWAEHLGTSPDDPRLLSPEQGAELWRATATAVDHWHSTDGSGPRPTGRVRVHRPDPVPPHDRPWADLVYRLLFDPDGRPSSLRRSGGF